MTMFVCASMTGKVFSHLVPDTSERSSRALQGYCCDGCLEKWIMVAMVFSKDGKITA